MNKIRLFANTEDDSSEENSATLVEFNIKDSYCTDRFHQEKHSCAKHGTAD